MWPIVGVLFTVGTGLFVREAIKSGERAQEAFLKERQQLREKTQSLMHSYVRVHMGDKVKKGFLVSMDKDIVYLLPTRPQRYLGHLFTPDHIDMNATEELALASIHDVTEWLRTPRDIQYKIGSAPDRQPVAYRMQSGRAPTKAHLLCYRMQSGGASTKARLLRYRF